LVTASIDIPEFSYPGSQHIVLHNIRMALVSGAAILLHGDNASGKSSLGKLLCGLLRPRLGQVLVDGSEVWRLRGSNRLRLAYYLGQEYSLSFYHATIAGELSHAMRLGGKKNIQLPSMSDFSLPDLDTTPLDLGSCAAWRLSLLCATLVRPRVLFIDEVPSLGSAAVVDFLRQTMQQRTRSGGVTVVSYQRPISLKNAFTQEFHLVDGEVFER